MPKPAPRKTKWRRTATVPSSPQLFNLAEDRSEQKILAESNPDKIKEMERLLMQIRNSSE